ncbi:lipoprotein [Flavonifractor plautii]|nr:lipoprotein [Flavonifractor plautii]MCB5854843.1 lipoprotein [Flavonifractor plautii]
MKKTWLLPALALAALAACVLLRTRRSGGAPAARKEPPYAL